MLQKLKLLVIVSLMFLLCLPSSPLHFLSCHVFIGRQTNVGLCRSHHIAIVDCLHGQVEDLATAGFGTATAGAAAQGRTDDGDDSLSQGGDGEDKADEPEDEISMEEHDGADDTEDEQGGGEQRGDNAKDQKGADVAGGGFAASDDTNDAGDDEEDATVESPC